MMILGEDDEHISNDKCTAIFNEMLQVKHKKLMQLGPTAVGGTPDAHHYMMLEEAAYADV